MVGAVALLAVAAIAATGAWLSVGSKDGVSEVQLGTLIHVWYGFDPNTGESVGGVGSSHWDSTVVVQPMKGLYTSDDPEVIRWQLNQMQEAGITWVLISWSGPATRGLPASYQPNGVHVGTHRAAKAVLQEIKNFPGQPIRAAILVEPWPDEAVLFGTPFLMTDGEKADIWTAIHDDLFVPYRDIWFELDGKPLVAAWMPMHIGQDARFTYRLMNVYEDVPAPSEYPMDWNMLDTKSEAVFEASLSNGDGFRKVSPRLNWLHLYMNGFRSVPLQIDPYFKDGWYDLQWQWVFRYRDRLKLLLVWTWNEYHEQNFIEPTLTEPEVGVGDLYRGRTRFYFDRLQSGEKFKRHIEGPQ